MTQQLPLPFEFHTRQRFADYHPGPNFEAVQALYQCATAQGESFLFLWGEPGLGKSHLLQACCHAASQSRSPAAYLPLARLTEQQPEILDGLGNMPIVCLDDVHTVAGREDWERGLFALFNALRDSGHRLIVTADRPPQGLPLKMPDLLSRFTWGLTLRLKPLDDEAKMAAMNLRAEHCGLELPPRVGRFLLTHYSRDLPSLWRLLDSLEHATLAQHRRLTVPFLKAHLEKGP